MSIREHAVSELDRIGFGPEDDREVLLGIMDKFLDTWDSGGAVSVMLPLLTRLLSGKPATPLTGGDDEWFFHDELHPPNYQNIRCSSVFKDSKDGPAYDIDRPGREHQPISFPYWPEASV